MTSELTILRLRPGDPGYVAPQRDEKPYAPSGPHLQLFYCKNDEVVSEGPAGTGKTRANIEKLHLCLAKYPSARALMVRQTRQSISQTCEVTYTDEVLPVNSGVKFNHADQEYRYPNGSVLVLAGMDDPGKALSSQYDIIYCNEVTELSQESYEVLTTRNRNGVMPYQQVIADCNPGNADHWLYQRAGVTWLFSTFQDNPRMYADGQWTKYGEDYISKLKRLTGYRYRRLYLGERCSAEGMYFDEWDSSIHVIRPIRISGGWTRWAAVDYGFDKPFCSLWAAKGDEQILTPGGMQRPIYVYRELYGAGVKDFQQADRIVQQSLGERIACYVADRSVFNSRKEHGMDSIADTYREHGLQPLRPSNSDRIAGWQCLRKALAHDLEAGEHPRLYVFNTCRNLIRTLPAMVVDPLNPEDLADKIKGKATEDHAVDALRYLLMAEAAVSAAAATVPKHRVRSAWESMGG